MASIGTHLADHFMLFASEGFEILFYINNLFCERLFCGDRRDK
tara:strand:- start:665 stop:793 length:129 start_codon:yes stop_codon:yes gene_type:complete